MVVYVATKNGGKLREIRAILPPEWHVRTHPDYDDVLEGETSYAENAALKAHALHRIVERSDGAAGVLGDDSGLEVAALGDRPGVLSARYGGPSAGWGERRTLLLAELAATGTRDRAARFVCALHYIAPGGRAFAVERDVPGRIALAEAGVAGFSYDPIFEYGTRGRTFAQLDAAQKNRVSHRARAIAALLEALRNAGETSGGT